jgi:hypothetical protein
MITQAQALQRCIDLADRLYPHHRGHWANGSLETRVKHAAEHCKSLRNDFDLIMEFGL